MMAKIEVMITADVTKYFRASFTVAIINLDLQGMWR
jgi:hypothetical protein